MDRALELITKPRYGLLYFETYKDLCVWTVENMEDISDTNGSVNKGNMEIKFPNGNILMLGYGEEEKYYGCEFLFVIGNDKLRALVRL